MQCVAVCCGVMQCVAVCCGVLQCVAVCCSIGSFDSSACVASLNTEHMGCVLQCVAVCCSVCCSVLQYVAVFQCRFV